METIDENSVAVNWGNDDEVMNPTLGDTTLIFTTYEDNIKFITLKRIINDFNMQHKMFNHFQGKRSGLLCRNLSVESFSILMKGYSRIWCDFVSFRIDLFEIKLKLLLYNNLNGSINM